ncbi:restriction endonuclease [Candidatus Saccharibacteria bacterium]|nr:restriction endonuclease [Candidatus Saccharibacteria bacterium]
MPENDLSRTVVNAVNAAEVAFSKFITANDTGATGAHQAGFYLHKSSWPLYFDEPGIRGSNKDKTVRIKWHDDFETESRFIYYGTGTRNEYRLTRFGRDFPFLRDENVGDLLVLCKMNAEEYKGYVLSSDEDIDNFLDALGISSPETNRLIKAEPPPDEEQPLLQQLFSNYVAGLDRNFPQTEEVADSARRLLMQASNQQLPDIRKAPDKEILRWIDAEYQLFRDIESDYYAEVISRPFENMDSFVQIANSVLNRRKSRAGKSLEHHLSFMFEAFSLRFKDQPKTEGKKRPDFIFPGEDEYHDLSYSTDNLIFLGAKTTCKDRWRQILNEADRIKTKHLFTLQQGISSGQLKEMRIHGVKLVVPKEYITAYPPEHRDEISPLIDFIGYVKEKQS